ncbi:dienelactone hydrolase family protein [Silvimonas sp. JCM 19000]
MPASTTSAERRDFLIASIATGFALAVKPVAASTIITDETGLKTATVGITAPGGPMPAYTARPANARAALPTIIVIQEIFGVHEHIQDLCRRLAKLGYLAIAPELYFRQGDPRKYPDIEKLLSEVVAKVPDAQVMTDLDATAAWASSNGGDSKKLAVTGFCWGGRETWLYAAHNPNILAAAAWYGPIEPPKSPIKPDNPIDIAASLKVPVIGFYGGKDQGISQDSLADMKKALTEAHKNFDINIYPDAGHGFNADYRPSYNAEAAHDAWNKMLAWFKKYGM